MLTLQDKTHCNSNSIFVPIQYLDMLQEMITKHDLSDDPNIEFLASIEGKFPMCAFGHPDSLNRDTLLLTVNYWIFPDYLYKHLNDPVAFAQFYLVMSLPCVDDDSSVRYIQNLDGSPMDQVYFQNDWLAVNN